MFLILASRRNAAQRLFAALATYAMTNGATLVMRDPDVSVFDDLELDIPLPRAVDVAVHPEKPAQRHYVEDVPGSPLRPRQRPSEYG